jgi:hypothetical protein
MVRFLARNEPSLLTYRAATELYDLLEICPSVPWSGAIQTRFLQLNIHGTMQPSGRMHGGRTVLTVHEKQSLSQAGCRLKSNCR